jgi:hypothetical protein
MAARGYRGPTSHRLAWAVLCAALCSRACGGRLENDLGRSSGGSGTQRSLGVGGSDALPGTGGMNASGGASSGGAAAVSFGGDSCAGYSTCRGFPPPVLNFTIDTSSAMGFTNAPSTQGRTKWEMTREILHRTFASLPASWMVGAILFNTESAEAVPLELLTAEQRARIDDAIDKVVLRGGMPLFQGWSLGNGQLSNVVTVGDLYDVFSRLNVLVVDGAPTVNRNGVTPGTGPNQTISQTEYDFIAAAVAQSTISTFIRTMVVGVPGSDDPQGAPYDPLFQLTFLAAAGGTTRTGCTPASGTVESCYDSVNQRQSTCLASRGVYCHQDLATDPDLAGWLKALFVRAGDNSFPLPQPGAGVLLDTKAIGLVYRPTSGVPLELEQSADGCGTGDFELYYSAGSLNPIAVELCAGFYRWMNSWDTGALSYCMDVISGLPPDASCTLPGFPH